MNFRGNKRLGLIGMRERIEMISGSFKVVSSPGLGTTVTAQIPFKRHTPGKSHLKP
jgi:signal transduction histidine kinase